jgi:hypothetical protein
MESTAKETLIALVRDGSKFLVTRNEAQAFSPITFMKKALYFILPNFPTLGHLLVSPVA